MTTPDNPPPPYGQAPTPPGYAAPPPGYAAPPAGYGASGPYGQPMQNGLGITALVLGLLSIPFGVIVVGGVLGLVAVVLGFVGRGRAKRGQASNGGVALAGILTGILGILIAIGVVVAITLFANSSSVQKLRNCDKAAVTQADKDQCATQFGKNISGSN